MNYIDIEQRIKDGVYDSKIRRIVGSKSEDAKAWNLNVMKDQARLSAQLKADVVLQSSLPPSTAAKLWDYVLAEEKGNGRVSAFHAFCEIESIFSE